jgi:hypothetical protein
MGIAVVRHGAEFHDGALDPGAVEQDANSLSTSNRLHKTYGPVQLVSCTMGRTKFPASGPEVPER